MATGTSRRCAARPAFYSHWDDHEFVNDFSPAENSFDNDVNVNGRTLYNRGQKAFRDYAPVSLEQTGGLYRTVRWGRNLELFFLDQRSFRSANADCEPRLRQPATRAARTWRPPRRRRTRNLFAVVAPVARQGRSPRPASTRFAARIAPTSASASWRAS